MAGFLIDTDIIIDLLRRREAAIRFIAGLARKPIVSTLTIAELFAGAHRRSEEQAIRAFAVGSTPIDVTPELAEEAGHILRRYRPSHGLDIVDATVAATAIHHGLRLATRNRKHFPMLQDLLVPY
jgi:predicted nucleic acid-binding protein